MGEPCATAAYNAVPPPGGWGAYEKQGLSGEEGERALWWDG